VAKHGTFQCYLKGCLCDQCFAEAMRVYKAREYQPYATYLGERTTRKIDRFEDRKITHGTRTGYVKGCRRECCAAPQREYDRQYRARKTLAKSA
jgi:hypothetical protein